MNTIQGIIDQSDYGGWDFMNYFIDDYRLNEKLDELYPDQMYKGLIPTLVYWMTRQDEKAVVWKRILPGENETTVCPILMCPDDNDFSCCLIVAEISNYPDSIQWKRLGLDHTNEWEAEKTGTNVEWFDKIPALIFSKTNYLTMLEDFKNRMNVDEALMKNS